MEQGSNMIGKEDAEMMNVIEVARMTECLKAMGLTEAQIIVVQNYIATGVGLPTQESTETEKESN